MIKHISILVTGKVQGVFFRASAKERADELEIKGFVENLSDGKVYIEAEGTEENLEAFKMWCSQGPRRAQVEQLEIKDGDLRQFTQFAILR